MQLQCLLEHDFVPMLKTPSFWISPKTLKKGALLDVPDQIGYNLLATFPGAFKPLSLAEEVAKVERRGRKPKSEKSEVSSSPSERDEELQEVDKAFGDFEKPSEEHPVI